MFTDICMQERRPRCTVNVRDCAYYNMYYESRRVDELGNVIEALPFARIAGKHDVWILHNSLSDTLGIFVREIKRCRNKVSARLIDRSLIDVLCTCMSLPIIVL